MSSVCVVASDTKLETPEGPLTVATVAKTPCSVLTRTDDGAVRFAMISSIQKVAEAQAVLRVRLDNGLSFRVGAQQVLFRKGMSEVPAGDLKPGDELEPVFTFPAGHIFRTTDGTPETARGALTVTHVEPAGESDLYSLSVPRTGRFLFSAGVLGKAA